MSENDPIDIDCWLCLKQYNEQNDPLFISLCGDQKPCDPSKGKYTKMHYCAANGHDKCLEFLLKIDKRGDIYNNDNQSGSSPLHLAIVFQHIRIILILLNNNADAYICNGNGVNCFELAETEYPLFNHVFAYYKLRCLKEPEDN